VAHGIATLLKEARKRQVTDAKQPKQQSRLMFRWVNHFLSQKVQTHQKPC